MAVLDGDDHVVEQVVELVWDGVEGIPDQFLELGLGHHDHDTTMSRKKCHARTVTPAASRPS